MVTTPEGPALFWFRDDLRLADNPGLAAAAAKGRPVALLYVLEDGRDGLRPPGSAMRWWLHHSLESLAGDIAKRGGRLIIRKGRASRIVPEVAAAVGAATVHWNRRYGLPAALDDKIGKSLKRKKIAVETHKAGLLFEPDEIRSKGGTPFQVYSAFWRAALGHGDPRPPIAAPKSIAPAGEVESATIGSLDLLPTAPNWATGIREIWHPGEAGAAARLEAFIEDALPTYAADREEPGIDGSSMLSPHLAFGEIGPFQLWHAIAGKGGGAAKFLAELGWREFAYHVLGQYPAMATENLKPAFDAFRWEEPFADDVWAWRRGRTGYPIVDAGMRQLWQTGWMHNRVRMIVASFLTKHLLIDWRLGEEWFWDTLVDADPANNPFNWQWVAGSGMDAQPYFRIFNPVLQGEKFDPKGDYVRKWVPELAGLSGPVYPQPLEGLADRAESGRDRAWPDLSGAARRPRGSPRKGACRLRGDAAGGEDPVGRAQPRDKRLRIAERPALMGPRPAASFGPILSSAPERGAKQPGKMHVRPSVVDAIGNTPLIRLRRASELTGCEIYGKAEFMNPGQSVKDRPARQMILAAEQRGDLKPGGLIVEGTAGNTGIGIALVARARGYRTLIVIPDTQSQEKKDMLRLSGATLIEVPAKPYSDPNNYQHVARRLADQLRKSEPNGVLFADQWNNLDNRKAHYLTTGPEIMADTGGKLDAFICSVGTGGTLAGVTMHLREKKPGIVIGCADPEGAAMYSLFTTGEAKASEGNSITEGIGLGRSTPIVGDITVDRAYIVPDSEALPCIFDLVESEGLVLGGSSGINIAGAIRLARDLGPGHTIVTVLCDYGTRYQSKLFNRAFLQEHKLPLPGYLAQGIDVEIPFVKE